MRVYLIRHGETTDNVKDVFAGGTDAPLSRLGEAQAGVVGNALLYPDKTKVVTSSQERALRAAEIITGMHRSSFKIDPRLCERSNGQWEGLSKSVMRRENPEDFRRWKEGSFRPSGGENFHDLGYRVQAAFDDLVKDTSDDQTILVVASGNPIRAIIGRILRIPIQCWQFIEQDHCGVSRIERKRDQWYVGTVNEPLVLPIE